MAKRFIDTSFYKSPFVRSLKGPLKSLYSFIICDCSGAGIWDFDLEIAGMYIGFKIDKIDFFDAFVKTGKAIDLENGRYFFPDFIEHQHPNGLSETNPAHKNYIVELNKYGLLDAALKPLKRPFEGSKVMVMAKAEVMVNDKVKVKKAQILNLEFPFKSAEFLNAWNELSSQKKWVNKSESALNASLRKLGRESELDAIKMIENCIAGNWLGLVELKPHEKTNTQNFSKQDGNKNPIDGTLLAYNTALEKLNNGNSDN
jgi:hypothetical protein